MPKIEKPSTFYMSPGKEAKEITYEDKFPSDMTFEEFKKQHGVVVWCKYYDCVNNKQFEDTQRTTGTIRKNSNYKPISEREHVWDGVCTRDVGNDAIPWTETEGYEERLRYTVESKLRS